MTLNLTLCIVLFVLFIFIFPIVFCFVLSRHQKLLKILAIICFIVYLFVLLFGTLCTIKIDYPNITFSLQFNSTWFSMYFTAFNFDFVNVVINLAMFLPIGFFVFSITKKYRFLKTILISLSLSLLVETLQWILPVVRNTEILDLILNVLSGILSFLVCCIISKIGAFDRTNC